MYVIETFLSSVVIFKPRNRNYRGTPERYKSTMFFPTLTSHAFRGKIRSSDMWCPLLLSAGILSSLQPKIPHTHLQTKSSTFSTFSSTLKTSRNHVDLTNSRSRRSSASSSNRSSEERPSEAPNPTLSRATLQDGAAYT